MNKTIQILFFMFTTVFVRAQSVTLCPLDLTNVAGFARIFSPPQHDVLWIGIDGFIAPNAFCKTFALSTDAGQTFRVDSVPDTAHRGISCLWALDSLIAWAGLTDPSSADGGAIWKTTDGGLTWTLQTVNGEYNGGFLDYLSFFTPDSGVAFGDRNGGYFEIYTTTNGGNTWTRVPSSNIPSALPNEAGQYGNYMSVVDNSIWCPTWSGRVYYSTDRGYHWQVSTVRSGVSGYASNISMSDTLYGAAVYPPYPASFFLTSDGGNTWNNYTLSNSLVPNRICRIPGLAGSYTFIAFPGIYVTTDNFLTNYPISSNVSNLWSNGLFMYDASIGWATSNLLHADSSLFKITDVITGTSDNEALNQSSLSILPNPVQTGYALVSWKTASACKTGLSLFDLQGRLLKKESLWSRQGANATVFNFQNLAPGMYLLRMDDGDASAIRVMVE